MCELREKVVVLPPPLLAIAANGGFFVEPDRQDVPALSPLGPRSSLAPIVKRLGDPDGGLGNEAPGSDDIDSDSEGDPDTTELEGAG